MHDPGRAATPTARLCAWMGAGVFVVSLSYFLLSYWTTFGRTSGGPMHMASVVWNIVLFSGFAAHHSLFAREPVRRLLTRALPHLERSVYVWIASLLFIAVCWLWQPVAGTLWEVRGAARPVLAVLHIGGIALSVYSAALIDVFELAGIRQLNAQRPTPDSQLRPTANAQPFEFKTQGPYGWVRHPIYLGWFLLVFSMGTMTMTRFVFAVVSCAYVLVAIPFEERSIRASAGGAYDRYAKQVPRKLIPGLY